MDLVSPVSGRLNPFYHRRVKKIIGVGLSKLSPEGESVLRKFLEMILPTFPPPCFLSPSLFPFLSHFPCSPTCLLFHSSSFLSSANS